MNIYSLLTHRKKSFTGERAWNVRKYIYYRLYIDLLHITNSHSVYVVYWTNVKACGKIVHTNFYCWASVNMIFSSFHLLHSLCVLPHAFRVCRELLERKRRSILELVVSELEKWWVEFDLGRVVVWLVKTAADWLSRPDADTGPRNSGCFKIKYSIFQGRHLMVAHVYLNGWKVKPWSSPGQYIKCVSKNHFKLLLFVFSCLCQHVKYENTTNRVVCSVE